MVAASFAVRDEVIDLKTIISGPCIAEKAGEAITLQDDEAALWTYGLSSHRHHLSMVLAGPAVIEPARLRTFRSL